MELVEWFFLNCVQSDRLQDSECTVESYCTKIPIGTSIYLLEKLKEPGESCCSEGIAPEILSGIGPVDLS